MATLISYESSGGDKGRCDAKCYNATRGPCHCICRGANHGKGLTGAVENTYHLADKWVEEYKREHAGAKVEVRHNWDNLRPQLTRELF